MYPVLICLEGTEGSSDWRDELQAGLRARLNATHAHRTVEYVTDWGLHEKFPESYCRRLTVVTPSYDVEPATSRVFRHLFERAIGRGKKLSKHNLFILQKETVKDRATGLQITSAFSRNEWKVVKDYDAAIFVDSLDEVITDLYEYVISTPELFTHDDIVEIMARLGYTKVLSEASGPTTVKFAAKTSGELFVTKTLEVSCVEPERLWFEAQQLQRSLVAAGEAYVEELKRAAIQ